MTERAERERREFEQQFSTAEQWFALQAAYRAGRAAQREEDAQEIVEARRKALEEVESFIAKNGRNADIQSWVETQICSLPRAAAIRAGGERT